MNDPINKVPFPEIPDWNPAPFQNQVFKKAISIDGNSLEPEQDYSSSFLKIYAATFLSLLMLAFFSYS